MSEVRYVMKRLLMANTLSISAGVYSAKVLKCLDCAEAAHVDRDRDIELLYLRRLERFFGVRKGSFRGVQNYDLSFECWRGLLSLCCRLAKLVGFVAD